jgi:hypothetical protein
MRHNFVNDIGDYATYALLRALCAADGTTRLGVIWYLTEHAERNGDGRKRAHLSKDGWDQLDPDLLATMRDIEATSEGPDALNLSLIERSGILPATTTYFAEAMPGTSAPARQRPAARAAWFERARRAVAGCDLVFLDPDNGLAVRSVPLTSSMAGKYATADEITTLLRTGAGVVLYQHGNRTSWPEQRQQVCARITTAADRPATIRSLRFGAFGVRAFFCITTTPRTTETVARGLDLLARRAEGWAKSAHLVLE